VTPDSTLVIVLATVAAVMAGVIAWVVAQGRARAEALEAEKRALAEQVTAQREFVEESRAQLEATFKALASDALDGSTARFLELAEQRWKTTREEASADLEKRRQAIETLLAPLKETLKNLDQKTGEIEKAREGAYHALKQDLAHLHETTRTLQERTTTLASALRGSQVRGRWGEIALRNIAELAGMSEHCDFTEQATVGDGKRPDMVVRLPEERLIAVDSKVPLAGYLKAIEATDETARQAGLKEHVLAVRQHIRTLAARDYAADLEGDVDLVVLFLPGDPFLAAAFSEDPDLQVEALRSKVLLATPTTLVALLRTVAIYHQQRALADNAREIADTARDLYERAAKFGEDLAKTGKGLKTAVDAYNRAVGSFERRFLPMGQKLAALKVADQARRELVAPDPLLEAPRDVAEVDADPEIRDS
jgi:DNA recombination protein RmuC